MHPIARCRPLGRAVLSGRTHMTDQSPSNTGSNDTFLKAFLPGLILGLVLGGLVGAVIVPLLSSNAPKPIGNGELVDRGDSGPRERGEQPGGELIDPDTRTPIVDDPDAPTDPEPDADDAAGDPPADPG